MPRRKEKEKVQRKAKPDEPVAVPAFEVIGQGLSDETYAALARILLRLAAKEAAEADFALAV
jgi:hypothetical protein